MKKVERLETDKGQHEYPRHIRDKKIQEMYVFLEYCKRNLKTWRAN